MIFTVINHGDLEELWFICFDTSFFEIEIILPGMDERENARFVTKGYNLETMP
jgi:hypothetical protein